MKRRPRSLAIAVIAVVAVACSTNEGTPSTEVSATTDAPANTTTTFASTTTTSALVTTTQATTTTEATEPETIEAIGVVIDVDGGLQGVNSFTLLLNDGTRLEFTPAQGLLFEGGPLSHLNDHVISGAPVHVVYILGDDGAPIAEEVGDA